jgi:hypothetical protein
MGSGGGGSTTTTVDPVYNAGMLKLSEEQQGWGQEMFNMFKFGVNYDPSEQVPSGENAPSERVWVDESRGPDVPAQVDIDTGEAIGGEYTRGPLIPGRWKDVPGETPMTTRGELEGYDPEGQTSEMQYLQNLVESNQSLLGLQTGAQKKRLELYGTHIDKINKGIDVGSRMDEAQAGVQHGFKNANRAGRMDIASYGLDPGSGRYASSNRDRGIAEASGVAAARTGAKNFAEQEDFDRRTSGLTLQ